MPVAVFCPSTPLLVKGVSGGRVVEVERVRAAVLAAVSLLAAHAGSVTLVGPDPGLPASSSPRTWSPTCEGTLGGFGVTVDSGKPCGLPPALAVGRRLLREAGFAGLVEQYVVPQDAAPDDCKKLGQTLADSHLLLLGDASICRSENAPGGLHPDAFSHDSLVARALAAGDRDALLALDPARSARLGATGRAAWQVLAGWAHGRRLVDERLHYCDAPFGVGYLAGSWTAATVP